MAHRDMSEMTRIAFHQNDLVIEPTIYVAATRILTGLIAVDKLNASNEEAILKKSVELALELAVHTDKLMSVEGNLGGASDF